MTRPHLVGTPPGLRTSAADYRLEEVAPIWFELGTHPGAVSPKYLDYYLDEFTFRFNRRKSRSCGKLFYRLLQQAVGVEPSPYRAMVRAAGIES